MGQSPWTLLTGLGAASAFLGLIFRNTLLSFASGIQLAMNDVVEVGDWIEAPDLGVNGTVSQMTFHAVRIQNWDKTLVAIPTYKLVEHPFKNWRGMAQFGCRRMKRQILIDPNSIRLQSEKASPKQPLLASEGSTNVERFRSQVLQALRQDPRIQTSITHMVRLLPPAPTGALPIEVYAFVTVTV
jgi:miniconductance mechanosensitive channel